MRVAASRTDYAGSIPLGAAGGTEKGWCFGVRPRFKFQLPPVTVGRVLKAPWAQVPWSQRFRCGYGSCLPHRLPWFSSITAVGVPTEGRYSRMEVPYPFPPSPYLGIVFLCIIFGFWWVFLFSRHPALLRYNRPITLHKFKVYSVMSWHPYILQNVYRGKVS